MNELTKPATVEEAQKSYRLTLRITTEIRKNLYDLAIVLKDCRDRKLYKFYNDTFEEYLANPEIGLSRFYVFKIIRNYEVWGEEYNVSQEQLRKIDPEKLYTIGTMITGAKLSPEVVEERLEQARNLSRSDVRQLKSGKEYELEYWKKVTCPKCGEEFKVVL